LSRELGTQLILRRLCLDIPTAGGRVLETAVEDFIKMKTTGDLGSGELNAEY